MKGKIKIITKKAFALLMATAMSVPTAAFAAEEQVKIYDQNSSVMGLEEKAENKKQIDLAEDNSRQIESKNYKLDIRARFDSLDKIIYEVKATKKSKEENTTDQDLAINFIPNPNSSIKKLKVLSAKSLTQTGSSDIDFEENSNRSDLEGLRIKTAAQDEIILEVAADIRQAKENRTYDMLVSLFNEDDKEDFSYNLITDKKTIRNEDDEIEKISLRINDKDKNNLKGEFESSDLLGLFSKKESITWTDYLVNESNESRETTYDFKLDDKQETKDTNINLDYYENTIDGFILKKEFSQSIPFANKIKFEIPADYIVKLSLSTKVDKKNTDVKAYSLNNRQVKNPRYNGGDKDLGEDDEEGSQSDDASIEKTEESEKADKGIKIEDAKSEEKEKTSKEDLKDSQIVVKDSNGNEIPLEIKEKPAEESQKDKAEEISALILNKDSLISRLKAENKLDSIKEEVITKLAENLNSYNEEKISDQELKDFTKAQATNTNIDKADLRFFIESILSGLNKQTNKAANLNIDEIIDYAYPQDTSNEKSEEKPAEKPVDKRDENPKDKAQTEKPLEEKTQEEKKNKDKAEPKTNGKNKEATKAFDEDLAKLKEAAKKEEKKTGFLDGFKSLMGLTDLAKADKELKAALADKSKTLEDIQNLLDSFERKYKLSKADQAKLMDDNADAIRALVEKDRNTNLRPHIFADTGANGELKLDGKKFTVRTIFKTSNAGGPVKQGQKFIIHLDTKLTVKEGTVLEPIKYNGQVIATPKYKPNDNTIEYTITRDINDNIEVPLEIPVDYNTANITLDVDGTFTVTNKVSGLGVIAPKDLIPQKMDKNGNPAGSIIEPGRNDVTKIIEPDDSNYKINTDAYATPVIKDGKLLGYNWTITVTSDTDLKDLGYKANFTTVKGSGLKEIKNSDTSINLEKQLDGAEGINDSKHHKVDQEGIKGIVYNLYTPVEEIPQEKYMMDFSVILTEKKKDGKPKVGAKRIVIDEGWPKDKVKEATPNRVDMNNRTTILGEFDSSNSTLWTVTDAVSTGDAPATLPMVTKREFIAKKMNGKDITTDLNPTESNTVVYKLDNEGNMVKDDSGINGNKSEGTIAVYEFSTGGYDKDTISHTLNGVTVSKYQDIIVDQNWNLPDGQKMPAQTITVTDKDGNETSTKVGEGPVVSAENGKHRLIIVPNVKYWDIDGNGNAKFRDHKVSQSFPEKKVTIGTKEYKYSENANYFRPDTKVHYIQNSLDEVNNKKPASFTVVKVDSKNPEKRVQGANFDLLGANVSVTTDTNGEATFTNIKPGRYYLTETKAPDGYKIDQNQKVVEISDQGVISVSGQNAKLSAGSGKTAIVEHSDYPNWPDFMNTMHYGKLDEKGNLEFYVYLKPFAPRLGGRTDKDTRFNISIPGVNLTNSEVKVYDLDPEYREYYTLQMQEQTMSTAIIFDNVIGKANKNGTITGTPNSTDPYTGNTGYSISIPAKRFGDDWGFLVKVNAKVGNNPVSLSYDWLADKDTATNSKIQEAVTISSNPKENGHPTITITNEEFKKSPIEVAKFADSLDNEGNRIKLPGAVFVLKDASGRTITNDETDVDGKVNFGEFPPGTYYLEEQTAPAGYEKSDVYFEVKVNEKGEVTYNAKFKTSPGTPVPGQDYFIDKGEATSQDAQAEVKYLYQHMDIKDSGRGRFSGVWEAYELESLKYELKATLDIAGPGSRFEVQFDKNLDFTQYFTEFPDLYDDGKVIAKPYFDRNTNLLTYVFTENAKKGQTSISFNLVGMIPNKFYAKTHGQYPITNVVQPGTTIPSNIGNQTETINVDAYFGEYDAKRDSSHKPLANPPTQVYYFRDVYQDNNGQWYVKAFAYYNPLGLYSGGARNINFNWMSTNFQADTIQHYWNANGNKPAFQLENVKVYRTDKRLTSATYYNGSRSNTEEVSAVMPLSMGIRPEQDPSTYRKVFDTNINPISFKSASSNDVYLEYNPNEIKTDSILQENAPLKMTMPRISAAKEGYVIEQTFKIPDIKKFNEKWRAFYMGQNTVLRSTFITGPNKNYGSADQTGGEIPKFYKEIVGIINRKYEPGQFKITKTEDNTGTTLQGAVFALTDQSGKTIYRSSDTKGIVEFKDLKPGRYTLIESRAPEGYTGSREKWEVIVSNDGSVRIEETSVTSSGTIYTGNNKNIINIPVQNRKIGENFQVFKKGDKGEALQGATFKITKQVKKGETGYSDEKTSNEKGLVEFEKNLTEGTYIIEETKSPDGYNKLDQKWVLVIDKEGNKKVYNYSSRTADDEKSLLGEEGTYIVNVKDRPQIGWESFDNRNTGWAGNSTNAEHLGTRIIAINKDKNYVIQRYIINPEAKNIDATTAATIHREKPNYPNMDWYDKDNTKTDYKVFTLGPKEGADTDGKVTGLISDVRLADYTVKDITEDVKKTAETDSKSHYGETRLKLKLPATNKPIVVDVKVPYKSENGGVGTGMDWRESGITYWKSDYYERVSDIVLGDTFASEVESIKGSYIGENSLDVTNETKTYGFKIKKVKEGATNTLIPGAKFKLTGPDESTIEMTTGTDGMISFDGLKPGSYTLEETEPAPGYEKSNVTWRIRVTDKGKVYIKTNETTSTGQDRNAEVIIQDPNKPAPIAPKSLFRNPMRINLLENASETNSGLEIGDVLADINNPLRADSDWEVIDPDITKGLTNDSRPKVQTKITEINKKDHRFRQIFLVNVDSYGITTGFDLHRYPEDYAILPSEIYSYTAKAVGKDSSLENILGTPKDIKLNKPTEEKKSGKPNITRIKFANKITTPVLVEIEASYDPNKSFGMGMDFYGEGMGMYSKPTAWGAQSYKSDKLVNKRTYSLTINPSVNGSVTSTKTSEINKNDSLTLTINPNEGYELDQLIVDDNNVTSSVANNKYPYTMPGHNVTVSATFRAKTYDIRHDNPQNGTISVKDKAQYGEKVEVTVTPKDGFKTTSVTMNRQTLTADNDGKYRFTMPAADANVSASFTRKGPEQRISSPVTLTEELDFEVQETLDNTLEPGQVVVEQTGKKGSVQYKYSITYEKSEGTSIERPADWPEDAPKAAPQAGERVIAYNKVEVPGSRINPTTQIVRKGPAGPEEGEKEIKLGEAAQITNKQTGLELNVFKVNNLNRRLQGAEFTIEKYTDDNYSSKDSTFPTGVTGTSDENGLVKFKGTDDKVVSLQKGHYLITESKSPEGYKKAQAPWKLEVYEKDGQLKAKYSGPEDTANGLLTSDKAKAESNDSTELQTTSNGIKYKSRLTYINPESKTYIQRIYIDTTGYDGTADKINVQITPKYKRDETDAPGVSPVTNIEGVKTAYRTTYKITGAGENPDVDEILRYYDLSKPNVSMTNTARWRPFDWGFDEDLLNLDKGVYFIDVEGFYDDIIITGKSDKTEHTQYNIPKSDLGKLDLNIDFYDGERKFQQATGKDASGNIIWSDGTDFNDAYLLGNVNLGYVTKNDDGQDVPTTEGLKKANPGDKYPLWIGKTGGRIYPALENAPKTRVETRVDISSLYASDSMKSVPQDGLTLTNEEETYNITFSKHGRDNASDDINSEKVTNKRLEGAIFKLQQDNGITYEDVPGSFVASAFNGYFGFRALKPGRYRLMEVQAPEGYKPINDPLLYFTVETITTNSGKIVHPLTGQEVDIKSIKVKFPGNETVHELKNLTMVDPDDKTKEKIVEISKVDSDKIDIETALIINPNDNTNKVPLKDLSIPGSDKVDYKIGDTRVVEGKSGYISLEYDKANGVYQYVPEKSTTTEEGKLIDFVTSATAKNMGKIINEKPGEGEVTIKKFDQNGELLKDSSLLPGAEFTLINLTNGDRKNGTIGSDGTLKFDKLQIGNYRLIETKSPDGYENNNQIWHFTVGGEGLDPYAGPIARTGDDLSDKISLTTEKASVLNPDKKTSTEITKQNKEVHPHLGESIEFENKFKLKADTKINPGDYFILKMSEDIDLNGIFEYEIENLDIIAPGVGTIAKADYNRNARTITYTFTDYAKTYTLLEFSNKLTAFIDLYKVKSNANKNVGFRIAEKDTSNYKNVNVIYDQDYGREADHFGNTINITSKIVKYDPKTGEFLHYYYINKLKDFSYGPVEFRYDSDQRIDGLRIDVAKVYNNSWNLKSTMPDSFAVNESSNNLYPFENVKNYQWLNKGYYASVPFDNGVRNNESYIVKVTGRVGDEDKSEYKGYGKLYKFNDGYTPTHAERHDSIRYFKNEATADAKLEIQAVNPENKIIFKKVDQNGKALAGAKFKLEYLAPTSSTWSGTAREPDENGVLTLTKLKPGKYKLTETSAPKGYKMAKNPIMEFEVDSNGKITKQVTSVDRKTTTTQDISGTTNYVVNSRNYEIGFKKVDADDNTKVLEGAEFEIWYKAQESDDYSKAILKLYQDASGNKIVLKADETAPTGYNEVKVFETGADGLVKFSFTEQGYYAIKETKAPKGYIAPREYVKEFVVKDGKVQADRYKTEMDVSKTKSWTSVNYKLNDVYSTDITMKFNSAHEKITYEKDKSTITLSGLPYDNDFKAKNNLSSDGITISAKLVNKNNQSSETKTYTLESTDYTNNEGKITIDLYELVKELEKKTGENADPITSENTIELSMYSTMALDTTLDITSKIEIGEGEGKISEERTFKIGTEGDKKVDHSYTFTKLGEPNIPILVENRKVTLPNTNGLGAWIGFTVLGLVFMTIAGFYYNKKKTIG